MLAILAPGQGAQTPGFLTPWLDVPAVAGRLHWLAAVSGIDLVRLGTTGTEDEIRDTATTQPLLTAAAIAVGRELLDEDTRPALLAGHSVGELGAAALAGAFSDETAMVLARERGTAMAAASALTPTGMAAVVGGDAEAIAKAVAEAGLEIANYNGSQIVVAGALDRLESLPALLPGVRVVPLKVAGAFHTSYMALAQDRLAALAPGIPVGDPRVRLVSNADGCLVSEGPELINRLVRQVAAPVRWDACMDTLGDSGVTAVVELAPAGTLSGLVKRALHGVEVVALKTPADLPAARRLLAEHGYERQLAEPAWRLVVAPLGGTFRSVAATTFAPGASLGVVTGRRDEAPVVTSHGGVLVEWLVHDGDPVKPGQPVARLHPLGAAS